MLDAVVGLGDLGAAIARRMRARGRDVIGVDPDADRREAWCRSTTRRAVAKADELPWSRIGRVIIAVRLPSQALEVIGVLARSVSRPTPCHVVSTLDLVTARDLGNRPNSLLRVLEQPVSGGAGGAAAGTLTVFSAGEMDTADREFLEATIAAQVIDLGSHGLPTVAKLVNNAAAAYHLQVLAALLPVAKEFGLEPALMHEVLQASSGGSQIGALVRAMAEDQFEVLAKDVELLVAAAGSLPNLSLLPTARWLAAVDSVPRILMESGHPAQQ